MITIGNISFGATTEYSAVFIDATGVVKGDDVRIAGVKVGTVKDIEIVDRDPRPGDFTVDAARALTGATHAAIRYRNLVGQRYIALTRGDRRRRRAGGGRHDPGRPRPRRRST